MLSEDVSRLKEIKNIVPGNRKRSSLKQILLKGGFVIKSTPFQKS